MEDKGGGKSGKHEGSKDYNTSYCMKLLDHSNVPDINVRFNYVY